MESWQYICAGYKKLPGCAKTVHGFRRCTFNIGPVPGTERALRPLGVPLCAHGMTGAPESLGSEKTDQESLGRWEGEYF